MIEITWFSKKYNPRKSDFAVENVNLKIEDCKITCLIGPNGSGKTTIMKVICGFHYPSSGNIIITDENNNMWNAAENPEVCMKLIGYVPEIPMLPPEMTVSELLNYAAETHEVSNLKESIEKTVEQCSIEKLLDKKIKNLSKGQQQRVSFAQALVHNPPNLILDEPISGLDPTQIIQMRNLIKKLSKKKAILMSTHILQEVYSLCSELYILNDGKIVASGTESQIITKTKSKNLEDAFIKLTYKEER